MLIKICGLTCPKEAEYLSNHKIDFAGMVLFYPKSKRNITLEQACEIRSHLAPSIRSVAVVVSPSIQQAKAVQDAGFDYIQIHGSLDESLLRAITIPVLKAFNLTDLDSYDHYCSLPGIAGFVCDAPEPGSGKAYDYSLLSHLPRGEKLFFLAGGLNPSNVSAAIAQIHPDGVDVSSGVEYKERPGKDPELIRQFAAAVHEMQDLELL